MSDRPVCVELALSEKSSWLSARLKLTPKSIPPSSFPQKVGLILLKKATELLEIGVLAWPTVTFISAAVSPGLIDPK